MRAARRGRYTLKSKAADGCLDTKNSSVKKISFDDNLIETLYLQLFMRRIMQLRAEIEDSRDLVLALCKEFLPESQWRMIAQDFQVGIHLQMYSVNEWKDIKNKLFHLGRRR
jgi:hypothetical protein